MNALDYLLKPINPNRLKETISRITDTNNGKNIKSEILEYNDRLFLHFNNKYKFIKLSEILCISSAGDYTKITLTNNINGLTNKSMNEWETRLPINYFCRIHRTTIINLEHMEKIEEWFEGSYRIYIKGINAPYEISRRYLAKIKDIMG